MSIQSLFLTHGLCVPHVILKLFCLINYLRPTSNCIDRPISNHFYNHPSNQTLLKFNQPVIVAVSLISIMERSVLPISFFKTNK